MTTCFWCDTVYDITCYERCPSCQTAINTQPITIIENPTGEFVRLEDIIKLLEEYLSAFQAPQEQLMQRRMADFVALIKGEQK